MIDKCPTCGRKRTRSSEQNKRYWAIISLLADKEVSGTKYNIAAWHTYFKMKFLGAEEITLPNGKEMIHANSTKLNVTEFNEYMTQVEIWANDHNIYLDE